MTHNFDVQLGVALDGKEHLFSADNVPGVGQLRIVLSTQMLHELSAVVSHASLQAKGYEELRVKPSGLEFGDVLISFPGDSVMGFKGLNNARILMRSGIGLELSADSDLRIIRAIS